MAELPALDDPAVLVEAFEQVVRNALAPIVERLKQVEALAGALGSVRAELAALAATQAVPGPAGANGVGLETVEYDGERTITLGWGTMRIPIRLPAMIYRGVWVAGKEYERGDCVTVGGSIYHANADTATRPGELAQAWTLAVKQGRDVPR